MAAFLVILLILLVVTMFSQSGYRHRRIWYDDEYPYGPLMPPGYGHPYPYHPSPYQPPYYGYGYRREQHEWLIAMIFMLVIGGFLWMKFGNDNHPPPPLNNPGKDENTIINEPRRGVKINGKNDTPEIRLVSQSFDVDMENIPLRQETNPAWVVFLRTYQIEENAYRLPIHFSQRDIRIMRLVDSSFLAYERADSKKEALEKIKDWKRYKKDYQKLGITPRLADLNSFE